MNPSNLEETAGQALEINQADRWTVYLRLRELDIPCQCAANQPLTVKVNNTLAAIQLWSVVRQLNSSRQELIWGLKRCWQMGYRDKG